MSAAPETIMLRVGQVWRAVNGVERRLTAVIPARAGQRASVKFRNGERVLTQTELSMRAWIGRNQARMIQPGGIGGTGRRESAA